MQLLMIHGSAFNPVFALVFSPNHLPRSQQHLVTSVIVVFDEEWPVLLHLNKYASNVNKTSTPPPPPPPAQCSGWLRSHGSRACPGGQ